jgi:hypothetical protein
MRMVDYCNIIREIVLLSQASVAWHRRLVAGLSRRRPAFDLASVHMGFLVDKVTLGQVFPRVIWFTPVSFIPPVLHYTEKRKKHKKPQGCDASVAMFPLSCAGARPRSNWNAPAHAELLPRSWNFPIFIINILITYITKKTFKMQSSRQVV